MTGKKSDTFNEVLREETCTKKTPESGTWTYFANQIIWRNFFFFFIHWGLCFATICMYEFGLNSVPTKRWTTPWAYIVGYGTGLGMTAGAHRLWTHRTYKAELPLKILLMTFYCTMGVTPLWYWIKDHRVHHRYSETDADPHNAKRGFVFSHIGWLVMKRHPECFRRGREVDMSDIEADPVVMFEKKYSNVLKLIFCVLIPTAVPVMLWEETILHAVLTQIVIRQVVVMNIVCCVNSVAHFWGSRPYNKLINPAENAIVSWLTMGEGSHNYHHTFPSDYKTSEFSYGNFNTTTLFIDAMAKLGWAYDLRQPSPEHVEKVIRRLGHKSNIEEIH